MEFPTYQIQSSDVNVAGSGNQPSTSKQQTAPVKRAGIQVETTAGCKAPRIVENKLTNKRDHRDSTILVTDRDEEHEQNDSHSKDQQSKMGPSTDLLLEKKRLVKKRTAPVSDDESDEEAEEHQPARRKERRTDAIHQCNSMCNID